MRLRALSYVQSTLRSHTTNVNLVRVPRQDLKGPTENTHSERGKKEH
jgi:hypothetical protein